MSTTVGAEKNWREVPLPDDQEIKNEDKNDNPFCTQIARSTVAPLDHIKNINYIFYMI